MNPLPGDYACVSIGGNGGTLIGLGEKLAGDKNTQYQHAFICTARGPTVQAVRIIEAEPGGAREAPLAAYGHIVWSTGKIALTTDQRTRIVKAALGYLGTGYSWLDYMAIALHARHIWVPWLKTYIASTKSMICSQLVDQCYQDAGVHLFQDGRWPGYVTPADLAALLEPVS